MSVVSSFKGLVRREITARSETIVGTVLGTRRVELFDGGTGAVWVVDVEIASNRHLRSVPIKAGPSGDRFYADRGQTVLLRRNQLGRFEVIGPGDKVAGTRVVKEYQLGTTDPQTATNFGFTFDAVDFEFYQGGFPPQEFWNDGVTDFPLVRVIDAQGNPVT